MRPATMETEEQRRLRVVSRIRNEFHVRMACDLIEMARVGKLPDRWMAPSELNQLLEDSGYWVAHPHVFGSFLSPGTCQDIVERALGVLANTHPDAWVRAGDQYKPATRDWNLYAARKANLIRRDLPTADRTALHTGSDGASVLFGHDDYRNDPRARQQVAVLRKNLSARGIPELGFGLSDDAKTWVMAVWSIDEETLRQALFDAWQSAFMAAA